MVRTPDEFREEFDRKGETFFEIADLLYTHPDREYTQNELAEKMNRSTTTISNHTSDMVDDEWVRCQEDQTTYTWNSDAHNPASTEGITAIKRFYIDLGRLLKKHSRTTPGVLAIIGFAMILAAIVVFAFFVGVSLDLTRESGIPPIIYLVIAFGSFLVGVIVTILSPIQALLHKIARRLFPSKLLQYIT